MVHAGWDINADDIEICTRPDATQWLLGEGQCGKVYKALFRGVQVGIIIGQMQGS